MAYENSTVSGNDIAHLLHRASQSADDLLASRISELNLTPRQITVLRAVSELENASQTALVDRTGIDRSTLADIVRRLVDANLLQRERARHDARMYAVALTGQGREKLSQAEPILASVSDDVLAAVPANARDALVSSLSAIVEALGPVASARVSPRSKLLAAAAE